MCARLFARKAFGGQDFVVLQLVVVGDGVRGLAVGSDSNYEEESDVLLAPGTRMVERGDTPQVWELH